MGDAKDDQDEDPLGEVASASASNVLAIRKRRPSLGGLGSASSHSQLSPAGPEGPTETWHSDNHPTRIKPIRNLDCDGCGRSTGDRDHHFPDEYVRWSYYKLVPRVSQDVKQPFGTWCWECDAIAEGEPEPKAPLAQKLKTNPGFKAKWCEEKLPHHRGRVRLLIASHSDRLPKQIKRKVVESSQAESRVLVQGTWLQENRYRGRFVDAKDRTHKYAQIKSPETGKMVKAYFVPDAESGVWRGEHGFCDMVTDQKQLAGEDAGDDSEGEEKAGKIAKHHMFRAPRVCGKTLAQIANEEAPIARWVSYEHCQLRSSAALLAISVFCREGVWGGALRKARAQRIFECVQVCCVFCGSAPRQALQQAWTSAPSRSHVGLRVLGTEFQEASGSDDDEQPRGGKR